MSVTTSIDNVRQEMPSVTTRLYFNAGTFGPIPTPVTQAMQHITQVEWQESRLRSGWLQASQDMHQHARGGVAHLLHAEEDEIALTPNTGEGLNIVCYGIHWREGDEIITTNHEHISALAPLYQIRDRYGVALKMADLGPQAAVSALAAIEPLVTDRTRLILLSHVSWTTGAVLDIKAVTAMGRARGIPVLIDGAQSAGAIPIDVKALEVDFYAIPMQKWLCGPSGTGALYVSQRASHYITPTYVGYMSMNHEEDVEWALHRHAQRFEVGGRATAAIAGQGAVLEWLQQSVGYEWIFERIARLHTYAYHKLSHLDGLTMLTPRAGASGILAFTLAGTDDGAVVEQLREKYGISIRNIPTTHALRVSTGFYNTEEEIDTLVQVLQEIAKADLSAKNDQTPSV